MLLAVLALWTSSIEALVVQSTLIHRIGRAQSRAGCISACDATTAKADAEAPAEAAEEEQGPQPGDFMKWYEAEKAREEYEQENPVDPVAKAISRIDGPLKTLAVLS